MSYTICEKSIELADHEDLLKLVEMNTAYAESRPMTELLESSPFFYVVYAEMDPRKLIAAHCSRLPIGEVTPSFNDSLNAHTPQSLSDCIYLTTVFNPVGYFKETQKRDPYVRVTEEKDPIIDSFLAQTYGNLVYHHQVEALYSMLTGCSPYKAKAFRTELYKKENWPIEEARLLTFSSGKDLKTVLEERMLFAFTMSPSYHFGKNLFEALELGRI